MESTDAIEKADDDIIKESGTVEGRRIPVTVFVSEAYRLEGDELRLVANVIIEAGFIELHSDVAFKVDEVRRALLVRSGYHIAVELTTADLVPEGFDPALGQPSMKPLILRSEYRRDDPNIYCGERASPRPWLQGYVTWGEKSLKLVDDGDRTLIDLEIDSEKEPMAYSIILDNSGAHKYAEEIQPDAAVCICPRYQKKYGDNPSEVIQYANQLYVYMGLVPYLTYSFIDQERDVEARGTRYGRFVGMELHLNLGCKDCPSDLGEPSLFLKLRVDPKEMESRAVVLKKTERGFVVDEAL